VQTKFLDLARLGKNDWWRYLISTAVILLVWLFTSLALALVLIGIGFSNTGSIDIDPKTSEIAGVDPLWTVTILLLSFLPLLVSLLLSVRFIHNRPATSLITPLLKIDWKRMAIGFVGFGLLLCLACLVESFVYPGRYQFTFKPLETVKFAPVILLLIPFQAASEELLCRGYMMQGIGLLTRRVWIPVVISSLIFMLLHISNPEAQVDTLLMLGNYLLAGLLFALVTIKDNRLELAIGMHIVNNVFVLLVNSTISSLPVPPVFTVTTLDAGYGLVSSIVVAFIFYGVLHFVLRSQKAVGTEAV
jgi:hypothetical protein